MTKSGIGTQLLQHQQQQHHHQTLSNHNMNNLSNVSSSGSSSTSSLIANAEIPIWVSDKKKWVTGISKKTTVNDLIYAILKQCQILPTHGTNQLDLISNQYVLVEYTLLLDSNIDQFVSASSFSNLDNQQQLQRILNGDSKVYKYLNKWANSQLMTNQQQQQQQQTPLQSNLMLKILQRQPVDVPNSDTIEQQQQQHQQSTSLATKLLKKFGVTNSPTNNTTQPITNNNNNNTKTVSQQILPNNGGSYRFVDVKLPMLSSSQSHPNQLNTSSSSSSNLLPSQTAKSSTNNLNQQQRNFDPNTQKSFLYNAIMEKDTKLKQQVKRFQLIDELLKETEKKSIKYPTSALLSQINSESVNNPTYTYSPSQSSSLSSTSSSSNSNQPQPPLPLLTTTATTNESKQFNTVDLNDVYCHFPEMCTHHLKEVEDFTLMCSQLFQLEEAIKSQKQVLSNLELDLQKELNQNNHQQQQQHQTIQQTTNIESVETVELRNEVNYSREQTRIQCKQLHDLDLRMRQNEQSLMVKEQQLQQLLEELYIQEIYADNALESAINTNTTNLMNNNNNNSTSNIGLISPLHQKDHLMDTSTTRHSELIINNELNSNNNNNNNNINYLTKRNVKMFGDSNDDMLINQALMQQKQHQSSIRINNLQSPQTQLYTNSTSNLQQKSQSIGNLAKSLPSPPPAPPTVLMNHHHNHHHNHQQQQQQIKQINNNLTKSNQFINSNNINSDHSGDNDSGISSMSSETNTNPILNNTNTSRHIVQNNQFLNNQQQFQHVYNRQQQQQQQQQQTQQVSPAGKSVLETLV